VEKYIAAGQATDGKMAHAYFMLDIQGYRHTLRTWNNIAFPRQQW
jgi:hypothetical protein